MKKLTGLLIFTVLIFINLSTFVLAEEGTISGYKKAITYLINKNQKISHKKNTYIFIKAFRPLWDHGEIEFIKTNWPKAIKLINWKSVSLAEIPTFRIFYNLGDLYASEAKYEESIKYYEMGINKLNEWGKDLPPSRLYAVYKRRMHVKNLIRYLFLRQENIIKLLIINILK